jgi:hypothetical protein
VTDEPDTDLARVLDEAVRDLQPAEPLLAEIQRRGPGRGAPRWVLPAALLAVLLGGLVWALVELSGGGHQAPTPLGIHPQSSTAPTATAPPSVPRCALATTRGDFDGNGTPDVATLSVLASAGQTCHQAQYSPATHHARFQLQVHFGSGGSWQRRFGFCTTGPCGTTTFTAADLAGDGRAELAVDLGPGAAVDFVEFFRLNLDGFQPLQIAPASALRDAHLKAGPAILGGGFDSGLQSPVSCQQRPNGTRLLVATRAEFVGANTHRPWQITRVQFRLHGDTLHPVHATTTTMRRFPITAPSFHIHCP